MKDQDYLVVAKPLNSLRLTIHGSLRSFYLIKFGLRDCYIFVYSLERFLTQTEFLNL